MDIKFKIATQEDVKAIVDLCNECFDETTSLDYALEMFKQTENDPNQIYLIGEVDSQVVAHTKITIIPTIYEKMNTYSILNHVCVKPSFRRHKLATKMLEECEKISKEHGCVKIELWSMNFREAAHACYKSYGFRVDDAAFFTKELEA